MPAVMPQGGGGGGVSCFDKMKLGFMMGMCIGMASGGLFGGFSALRYIHLCSVYGAEGKNYFISDLPST